jgi:hypothetical protein
VLAFGCCFLKGAPLDVVFMANATSPNSSLVFFLTLVLRTATFYFTAVLTLWTVDYGTEMGPSEGKPILFERF